MTTRDWVWPSRPLYHRPPFATYAAICRKAETLATSTLLLPVHPGLSETALEWVTDQLWSLLCRKAPHMTGIRHFTASAIVFDYQKRVLIVHHSKIGQWLYPGGHIDSNEDPAQAARRAGR